MQPEVGRGELVVVQVLVKEALRVREVVEAQLGEELVLEQQAVVVEEKVEAGLVHLSAGQVRLEPAMVKRVAEQAGWLFPSRVRMLL